MIGFRAFAGALLAALAVTVLGGCFGAGGKEDPGPDAAVAFRKDLREYADGLEKALRAKPTKDEKGGLAVSAIARAAMDPPELEDLDSEDEGYLRAGEVADRLKPMSSELRALAGTDLKRIGNLYSKLYSLASDQYDDYLRFNDDVFDASTGEILDSKGGIDFDRVDEAEYDAERKTMRDRTASWKRYVNEVEKVPIKTGLERSAIGFEVSALEEEIALFKEATNRLAATDPGLPYVTYYEDMAKLQTVYPIAMTSVGQERDPLIRGMIDGIVRLKRSGQVVGTSPAAGDPYRERILAGFVSSRGKDDQRENKITNQLWLLRRMCAIEKTQPKKCERVRQTIALEDVDDPRNGYNRMFGVFTSLHDFELLDYRDLFVYRDGIKWAQDLLTRPIAPILESSQKALSKELDGAYTGKKVTTADDLDALIERIDQSDKAIKVRDKSFKKQTKIMNRAAKATDDTKKVRKSLAKLLEATRPEPPDEDTDAG